MAAISDVRAGIRDRLLTIAGLNVYDRFPEQIAADAALIRAVSGQHEGAFGPGGGGVGRTTMQFEVHVMVSLAGGLDYAQQRLDPYLSNTGVQSVRTAIQTDPTLGAVANYTFIRGWRDYDSKIIGSDKADTRDSGVEYLGAIVDVEVDVS